MIELEKTVIAIIMNHLQPFVERVNNILKEFKEWGCSKDDIKSFTKWYLEFEIHYLKMKCITVIIVSVIVGVCYILVHK